MRWILLGISLLMAGMGCAASCPNIKQDLDACRQTIQSKDQFIEEQKAAIKAGEEKIAHKNERIDALQAQVAELERRLNIADSEQDRYDERIRRVTAAVREYVKEQIQEGRTFLTDIALEDFIGNPLIAREHMDTQSHMIVDMAHPVPAQGQINGVGGYFKGSGEIVIKLLRPVGEDYIVTYSQVLAVSAEEAGRKLIDFEKPVLVNKGDVVAYYLIGPAAVSYDSKIGTNAYLRMRSDKFPAGERIEADDIWQPNQAKRKYSLNYYGIFVEN